MQEASCGEMQHGHMDQVGYEMYCRLLDEVVKEEMRCKVGAWPNH